jgi:hypothetical protein
MEEFWAVGNALSNMICEDDSGRPYIYNTEQKAEVAAVSLRVRHGTVGVFKVEIERGK